MTWELTEELTNKIADRLAEGRSLISICKDDDMPCRSTVNKWLREDKEFCTIIARARMEQADYYLDKQIEFAEIATVEDYQLRKFQADNLKWVASKLAPKKYGDSTTIKGDAENPLTIDLATRLDKAIARAKRRENESEV